MNAWKEAHCLVLIVYKTTREFPKEERFSLTDQMRRAAISITSNVAEGFSKRSTKEKIRFYSIAKGSNSELQSQTLIARDLDYLDKEEFNKLANQSVKTNKLLSGLIRHCKRL